MGGGVRGFKARRVLEFFRVNFGVCAPYQVVCDGTLIHRSLTQKIFLRDALPITLGRTHAVRIVVTACVVAELRSLGAEASAAAMFARRSHRVECPHGAASVPAAECLRDLFSDAKHGMLLGTIDPELIRTARSLGCVPIVTISSGSAVLERPSTQAQALAMERERGKRSVSTRTAPIEVLPRGPTGSVPDRAKPRRHRRAKGPNPLSVKKKKKGDAIPTRKRGHKRDANGGSATAEAGEGSQRAKTLLEPPPEPVDVGPGETSTVPSEGPRVPSNGAEPTAGGGEGAPLKPQLVRVRGRKKRRAPPDAEKALGGEATGPENIDAAHPSKKPRRRKHGRKTEKSGT